MSVDAFWKTDMTGKVLYKATFPDFGANDKVVAFKVMPRSQVGIDILLSWSVGRTIYL